MAPFSYLEPLLLLIICWISGGVPVGAVAAIAAAAFSAVEMILRGKDEARAVVIVIVALAKGLFCCWV
jgi:hypothetical protein